MAADLAPGSASPAELPQKRTWCKTGRGLWFAGWALLLAMHLFPIRFTLLRELFVLLIFSLWCGTLVLYWKQRWVVAACGIVAAAVLAIAIIPGGDVESKTLRGAYVSALRSYEATPYVWGGETRRGIDCSGLVRCAMIDANVDLGLRTLNPQLLRNAFSLWWHDCSAKALGEEHRGQTSLLEEVESINSLGPDDLLPGDIAVTKTGLHTMAYLGEGEWIEADPSVWKVIRHKAPDPGFSWFTVKMRILRWRGLIEQV
jgi:hypothetical protein